MSEFEQGLANIMGSFIQTELDCVEKQNQEIGQLKQENQQLKLDFDLYKDNHIYKNYEVERKDKQLDLYKSVINELREIITVNTCWDATTKKAFEILSKAEGSDK